MTRLGIFLCTCDQKINKGVDVDVVEKALRETPRETPGFLRGIAEAERSGTEKPGVWKLPHACLPDGLRDLRTAIVEDALERVVVAACPARFQEKHLRDVCVGAGINPNHFALLDWREGCAWAHRGDKQGATAKAIDLIQMGAVRVTTARAPEDVLARITPRVLVIGGGIAGMTAAHTLAECEISVTLVEQEAHLGGQLRHVPLDGAMHAYNATMDAVRYHPYIRLRLNSRILTVHGAIGDYRVEIQNATTNTPETINVGAIIVATGAQEYQDVKLYRHDGRRVVTQREFEAQLAPGANIRPPASLVYILCAGSRDGLVPYCSNVCCLAALRKAMRLKRADPIMHITILFRDLNLLGDELNEEVVRGAQRVGVQFVRYVPANPPRVDEDAVEVRDVLTGLTRRIEYDRVVLAAPLVPRDDGGTIAYLLNLERDEDGFFRDPHLRLRPERQIERSIFVCGSAHRPVDVDTAIMQGVTTAARVVRFLRQREVMRSPLSARVNEQLCTGCAQCVEMCAFHAIEMRTPTLALPRIAGEGTFDRARIDPFLCLACGNCVVACPSKAIELPNASDAQILGQIEAALARRDGKPRSLVFACQWSGFASMELAGARRMNYPANVRVIELPCSARLDPLHVLYAFINGAARVLLALCPPNECHFGNGNRYAEARTENLRAQLAAHGIDPQRLTIARMMGDDAGAWVRAVTETGGG